MQKYNVLHGAVLYNAENVRIDFLRKGVVAHLYARYADHMATAHAGFHSLKFALGNNKRLDVLTTLPQFNNLRGYKRIALMALFTVRRNILCTVFH